MAFDATVIIAAHDAGATIRRAIDSALAQRDVTIEVVVVDDASTDDTRDIVSSYCGDTVRLISLPVKHGAGGARNAGLAEARGDWIAILDADDAFLPSRIDAMLGRARSTEASIVVDNLDVTPDAAHPGRPMFPPGRLARLDRLDLATFIGANRLFEGRYTLGYVKPVLRRDFVERHGLRYCEDLRIGEDYLFLAQALAAGGVCAVEPRALYRYRVGHASTSRRLLVADVVRMKDAEIQFLRRSELGGPALKAHARRMASLERGEAFLRTVEFLKTGQLAEAVRSACRNPHAMRHFWIPIAARFERIGTR